MQFINGLLLSVTFIASITLLAIMQQWRLIGRLLLFFVLLVFYVLRSAVLLFGMKALDRTAYLQVAFVMSFVDLGLQLALAWSLARYLTQFRGSNATPTQGLRNSVPLVFALSLLLAAGLTVALVSALPAYSPVPLDRGVVFSGLVFLLLLFLRSRNADSPEAAVLTGFAAVSATNILSQCGRTMAAAQRDPRLFLAWAYANTAVWICVLVFWILRLAATEKFSRLAVLATQHPKSEPNAL